MRSGKDSEKKEIDSMREERLHELLEQIFSFKRKGITLPKKLTLTALSKQLLTKAIELQLTGQGLAVLVNLTTGEVHLVPAFNKDDGLDAYKKHFTVNGKPYYVESKNELGKNTGDVHTQAMTLVSLHDQGGVHGGVVGLGLFIRAQGTKKQGAFKERSHIELRNSSSSQNKNAIAYSEAYKMSLSGSGLRDVERGLPDDLTKMVQEVVAEESALRVQLHGASVGIEKRYLKYSDEEKRRAYQRNAFCAVMEDGMEIIERVLNLQGPPDSKGEKHPIVSIDAQDDQGNTLLHYATLLGYEKIGNFLLEKGASKTILNKAGESYESLKVRGQLAAAIRAGNLSKVKEIVEPDPSILNKKTAEQIKFNKDNRLTYTPLMLALSSENDKMVEYVLGKTPIISDEELGYAYGYFARFAPNELDGNGLLTQAMVDLKEALPADMGLKGIEPGPGELRKKITSEIDKGPYTYLDGIGSDGNYKYGTVKKNELRYLVDNPSSIKKEYRVIDLSAYQYTISKIKKYSAMYDRLTTRGIMNILSKDKIDQYSLDRLNFYIKGMGKDCPTLNQALNDKGETMLMVACSLGLSDAVSHLLKIGVDVTIKNKQGQTVLDIAAAKRYDANIIEVIQKDELRKAYEKNEVGTIARILGQNKKLVNFKIPADKGHPNKFDENDVRRYQLVMKDEGALLERGKLYITKMEGNGIQCQMISAAGDLFEEKIELKALILAKKALMLSERMRLEPENLKELLISLEKRRLGSTSLKKLEKVENMMKEIAAFLTARDVNLLRKFLPAILKEFEEVENEIKEISAALTAGNINPLKKFLPAILTTMRETIRGKAELKEKNNTLLIQAIIDGKWDVAKLLLARGAKIKPIGKDHKNALDLAKIKMETESDKAQLQEIIEIMEALNNPEAKQVSLDVKEESDTVLPVPEKSDPPEIAELLPRQVTTTRLESFELKGNGRQPEASGEQGGPQDVKPERDTALTDSGKSAHLEVVQSINTSLEPKEELKQKVQHKEIKKESNKKYEKEVTDLITICKKYAKHLGVNDITAPVPENMEKNKLKKVGVILEWYQILSKEGSAEEKVKEFLSKVIEKGGILKAHRDSAGEGYLNTLASVLRTEYGWSFFKGQVTGKKVIDTIESIDNKYRKMK